MHLDTTKIDEDLEARLIITYPATLVCGTSLIILGFALNDTGTTW